MWYSSDVGRRWSDTLRLRAEAGCRLLASGPSGVVATTKPTSVHPSHDMRGNVCWTCGYTQMSYLRLPCTDAEEVG
jgi:hypothetical protein